MLRINRTNAIGTVCLLVFLYYLLLTESASTSSYRTSTEAALARSRAQSHHSPLRGELSDEALRDKVKQELNEIVYKHQQPVADNSQPQVQAQQQDHIQAQAPQGQDHTNQASNARQGQVERNQEKLSPQVQSDTHRKPAQDTPADSSKDIAREKLSEYLKQPIVIFSKSYCPHSKRAKQLLLDTYRITPRPVVVELDQLTEMDVDGDGESEGVSMGRRLQDLLGEVTGRKTVPNVMVGGLHSIGGNDLIWDLHEHGLLAEEIRKLGGKKIVSVDLSED